MNADADYREREKGGRHFYPSIDKVARGFKKKKEEAGCT